MRASQAAYRGLAEPCASTRSEPRRCSAAP